ncbi:MAG: DUF4956 domain-containing protein [Candidatus Omnitrophica bacterium]|nr:DUF4956 domain-containing protein [Candidatus Omnitrophota bacterium]
MNKIQTFQEFLTTQSPQVQVLPFMLNLLLSAILACILGQVYIKYGVSLSNRRLFSRNFIILTMTTMLIITIVKSSLALSLGLVGALSIVRFRAAIKEPEELAYLFLSIAIGLGFGADQRVITLVAFVIIVVGLMLTKRHHQREDGGNLYVTVLSHHPGQMSLEQIASILKEHCLLVDMKRFDESQEVLEASFLVEFSTFEHLTKMKNALKSLSDSVTITFLDHKGSVL